MKQNKRIAVHHTRALQEQGRRIQAEHDSKMKSAFLSNMSQYAGDQAHQDVTASHSNAPAIVHKFRDTSYDSK
jgi:hypothetical protein